VAWVTPPLPPNRAGALPAFGSPESEKRTAPSCRTSESLLRANSRTECVNPCVRDWFVAGVQIESSTRE
jgi:hypothetical protein